MTRPLTVGIAGIGGYGNGYVSALLDAPEESGVRFVGCADPSPASCARLGDLRARGVPVHSSLQPLYAAQGPELLIIASPLQFHADHVCEAVSGGSHVLCEKPLCVTPEQVRRMMAARDAARRHVAIGYQWSFSAAMQALKADVMSGAFGRPVRLRSLVLWPRDETYYRRNRWAGMQRDPAGTLVLDSPVNNACAHHLHNMFYVLGPRIDLSATPERVGAELYRAHAIDNYDTAVVRCHTRQGADVLLVTSHATEAAIGPVFRYEFEKAVVEYCPDPATATGDVTATFSDGTAKRYGSPVEHRDRKLWATIDAVRQGREPVCGIEAAAAHTMCSWAAQQCVDSVAALPADRTRATGTVGRRRIWVDGLGDELRRCYDAFSLPSEMAFDWARPGREVSVDEVARGPIESDPPPVPLRA